MRTKTFQGLSFLPLPNYERFLQISESPMFIRRKEDEERLKQIAHQTVEKYRNADSVDYEEYCITQIFRVEEIFAIFANLDFARYFPPAKIISTANGISRNFPPVKFSSRRK